MSRPLDAAGMALVVVLCLSWGFNQLAIKLALAGRAAADPVRDPHRSLGDR